MSDTLASGGPCQHQVIISSMTACSPSKTASTFPSTEFLTQPMIPSASAFCLVLARYQTPCTRPEIRTWTRVFIPTTCYGLNRRSVRGNGIVSLMFSALQIQAINRSTPRP